MECRLNTIQKYDVYFDLGPFFAGRPVVAGISVFRSFSGWKQFA